MKYSSELSYTSKGRARQIPRKAESGRFFMQVYNSRLMPCIRIADEANTTSIAAARRGAVEGRRAFLDLQYQSILHHIRGQAARHKTAAEPTVALRQQRSVAQDLCSQLEAHLPYSRRIQHFSVACGFAFKTSLLARKKSAAKKGTAT